MNTVQQRTKELLNSAGLLHLNNARSEGLDGRNVVGEDTHLARLCGNVDLDNSLRVVDGLRVRHKHRKEIYGAQYTPCGGE